MLAFVPNVSQVSGWVIERRIRGADRRKMSMNSRTTSRPLARRIANAVAEAWADCQRANRLMVQKRMGRR